MSGIFWVITILMVSVAVAFVALPLVKSNRKGTLGAIVAIIPLIAAGVYLQFGSPDAMDNQQRAEIATTTPQGNETNVGQEKIGSVASLVAGLAERVHENPDDGSGWLLLARSYQHLRRPDDAAEAYRRAAALGEYDAELAAANGDAGSSVSAVQISGNVQLSPDVAVEVQPTDIVFIFAKAVDGPAAPVAVLKRAAAELPLDFRLDDSQSMVSGVKLSDFDEVVVTARITRGGEPTTALQGLEAESDPVLVAENRHLNLTIK